MQSRLRGSTLRSSELRAGPRRLLPNHSPLHSDVDTHIASDPCTGTVSNNMGYDGLHLKRSIHRLVQSGTYAAPHGQEPVSRPKEPVSPPSSKPATAMKDATHRGLGTRHATARNPWLFPKKCAEICSYDRMWLAVAVRLQCNYCMAPDVRMHSALSSIDAAPL